MKVSVRVFAHLAIVLIAWGTTTRDASVDQDCENIVGGTGVLDADGDDENVVWRTRQRHGNHGRTR